MLLWLQWVGINRGTLADKSDEKITFVYQRTVIHIQNSHTVHYQIYISVKIPLSAHS